MKSFTPAFMSKLMFGFVGVLVMAYFAKTMFAQKEKPAVNNLREVPMAVTDISAGTMITADHLGMGRYDRTKLTPDVLLANRVIVGRVAKEAIRAANPIKAGQLYQPGELPRLDMEADMRAVSVDVGDGVAVVDGIIKPGDTVDVLFTAQGGGVGNDNTYQGGLTLRLFEGVKVLAINRNFAQGRVDRGNNHVTLELTVAQQNIIVLAKDRGKITLTYNPNGKGNGGLALSNSERVTLFELLGLEKSDPQREPFTTEIYRGSGRAINRFDDRGRNLDSTNRNAVDNNQNTQYQLPSSNNPSRNQTAAPPNNSAPANGVPTLNGVPSRPMHQTFAPNIQQDVRPTPTAQLLQPRN